jgi:tRNA (guanine-N7-)-methyltransferase
MTSKACENVALDIANLPCPIDLQSIFPAGGPVHIEIGPGKGAFLVQQAQKHPDLNFLGIEWASKCYRYCVDRMQRRRIPNVRLIRTDARLFLALFIPDESIAAFHVYFPDPWPKTRHHKRRFFCPENLAQLFRCLAPGGEFRTATDHAGYFEIMRFLLLGVGTDTSIPTLLPDQLALLATIRRGLEPIDFFPADAANPGEWVGSNFERKYRKQGRQFFTLAFRKRS